MVSVRKARLSDRQKVQELIAEYHASEGLIPRPERIAWAVDQQLRGLFPGLLLVASSEDSIVGVALAVFQPSAELGRVMVVHDFFVAPAYRRRGVGRELAKRLVKDCNQMRVDEIDLEVIDTNKVAAAFWRSMEFETAGRTIFKFRVATAPS